MSPPIHPLTSSQGAVFLVNSRQRYFSCIPASIYCYIVAGKALSRSYGRFFAEFLREESPVHLRLLASPTGVGLRYGLTHNNLRRFSWRSFRFHFLRRNGEFSHSLELPTCAGTRTGFSWHASYEHEHKSNNMRNLHLPVTP